MQLSHLYGVLRLFTRAGQRIYLSPLVGDSDWTRSKPGFRETFGGRSAGDSRNITGNQTWIARGMEGLRKIQSHTNSREASTPKSRGVSSPRKSNQRGSRQMRAFTRRAGLAVIFAGFAASI